MCLRTFPPFQLVSKTHCCVCHFDGFRLLLRLTLPSFPSRYPKRYRYGVSFCLPFHVCNPLCSFLLKVKWCAAKLSKFPLHCFDFFSRQTADESKLHNRKIGRGTEQGPTKKQNNDWWYYFLATLIGWKLFNLNSRENVITSWWGCSKQMIQIRY